MNQSAILIHKAIIPAAGRGTRLGSLTQDRPKPMVLLQGKPVLEHILVGVAQNGIDEFLIVVGHMADSIRDYFGDGSKWNVKIAYQLQATPTGTASALLLGREFANNDPVIATYGDVLTAYSHYRTLIESFGSNDCSAVIGINPVDDPTFGAAVFREGSRITRVQEKPPAGTSLSKWNIAGVSAYGSDVWAALADVRPSPRGEFELTDAISTLIAAERPVISVEMTGFWSDIGTPDALESAQSTWQT